MVTTQQLKELLIETFDMELSADDISDDMAIIGEGLELDSVDMLEIISQIDKKFGARIKNDQIKKEYFASIQSLTNFINTVKAS